MPGIIGSGLGLVDPVSVYCVWEMASLICKFCLIEAALHLSEQICLWDALTCCWDVKLPTNRQWSVWWLLLIYAQHWYSAVHYYNRHGTGTMLCTWGFECCYRHMDKWLKFCTRYVSHLFCSHDAVCCAFYKQWCVYLLNGWECVNGVTYWISVLACEDDCSEFETV